MDSKKKKVIIREKGPTEVAYKDFKSAGLEILDEDGKQFGEVETLPEAIEFALGVAGEDDTFNTEIVLDLDPYVQYFKPSTYTLAAYLRGVENGYYRKKGFAAHPRA